MSRSPPMITARALGAMPQFILDLAGERGLDRALLRSGLPYRLIHDREGYIPEHALGNFVDEAVQASGYEALGLLWAPHLSVADYGLWGAYVLAGDTLGETLRRATTLIGLHGSDDRLDLTLVERGAVLSYAFGHRAHPAYANLAFLSVGVMRSFFTPFLGGHWTPAAVEVDMARPAWADLAEDTFQTRVFWDMPRLAIRFDAALLGRHRTGPARCITVEDVLRERVSGPPRDTTGKVAQVIGLHLDDADLDLERSARALGLGPRSLQRRLRTEGTSFRETANRVRFQRAQELIREGRLSLSRIAVDLGYTSPANFSRAFKSMSGLSPRAYARQIRHQA